MSAPPSESALDPSTRPDRAERARPARSGRRARLALALSLVPAACLVLLACAPWVVRAGLNAVYLSGSGFDRRPLAVEQRAPLWVDRAETPGGVRLPETFSVRWTGAIGIDRTGEHRFALRSDDGSRLLIDGAMAIDNGGTPGPVRKERAIHLSRGVHRIEIRYTQLGGPRDLLVLWAPPGERWRPLDQAALYPRTIPWWQHRLSRSAKVAGPPLFAACGVLLTVVVGVGLWRVGWKRLPGPSTIAPALAPVLVLALGLGLVGLDWGLADGWAPDEISASKVVHGAARWFSNGWFDAYPPLQFYVLAITAAPAMLADAAGVFTVSTHAAAASGQAACRLVSLAIFIALVAGVYRAARMIGTEQDGVLAALMIVLVAPLSFYSKTVNFDVPYLWWFVLSLPCWLALRRPDASLGAHVGLAVTATCAVCTKDQAYGFYALLPLVLLLKRWRDHRGLRWPARVTRTLGDSRVWVAAIVAMLLFAALHNFPFNWRGFVHHVSLITGGHSQGYRMFPNTWLGHVQMAGFSARLMAFAMGWPLFLLCVAGLVAALADRGRRPAVSWLLVPAVSYTLTFTHVVLYSYDRFELGGAIVLAIAAAPAIGRWWRTGQPALRAAIATVCVVALLDAASVGVLMAGDARRSVDAWARAALDPGARIGSLATSYYLPHLALQRKRVIRPIPEAIRTSPVEYLIVNDRYAARLQASAGGAASLAGLADGSLGFTRIVHHRTQPPWWALLAWRPAFAGPAESGYTNLDKINPPVSVYRRGR